jgi:hypothetical protein
MLVGLTAEDQMNCLGLFSQAGPLADQGGCHADAVLAATDIYECDGRVEHTDASPRFDYSGPTIGRGLIGWLIL